SSQTPELPPLLADLGLNATAHSLTVLQNRLYSSDSDSVSRTVAVAGDSAASAKRAANSLSVRSAAMVPGLGLPVKVTRELAGLADEYLRRVVTPLSKIAPDMTPRELRDGDRIATAPLAENSDELVRIAASSRSIESRAVALPSVWVGAVDRGRKDFVDALRKASLRLDGLAVAAQLLPSMIGSKSARFYFVGVQTPSESRATGGLLGGYSVVKASDGELRMVSQGENADFISPGRPQVDLGPEFNRLYEWTHPYTDNRNSNISPDFRDAARIWLANWQAQHGQKLDGAVALDPIALQYVMEVTGPVRMRNGRVVTAKQVAPLLLSQVYIDFRRDNDARKDFLQDFMSDAVSSMLSFKGDTGKLLEALGRGVAENRIMLYSAHPEEQTVIEETKLGHHIPGRPMPYMNVTVGNVAGNKIDYYLKRDISYHSGSCSRSVRRSTASIRLRNEVPDKNLPPYVVGSLGAPRAGILNRANAASVQFVLTQGATVQRVRVGNDDVPYFGGQLSGHPVTGTQVIVPANEERTVTVDFDEPTSAKGEALVPIQPLVDDPMVTVSVPACGK
ncbi:MAG TPA: DUF4012 domain-containing protein, partial [Gordonia sp. (in: high G+C Gram-positive bacteria)]|nr:DUF4012 domain-containing protein [Gordonia sp. (in: high G+C Gram-positive bacteria)]